MGTCKDWGCSRVRSGRWDGSSGGLPGRASIVRMGKQEEDEEEERSRGQWWRREESDGERPDETS